MVTVDFVYAMPDGTIVNYPRITGPFVSVKQWDSGRAVIKVQRERNGPPLRSIYVMSSVIIELGHDDDHPA